MFNVFRIKHLHVQLHDDEEEEEEEEEE